MYAVPAKSGGEAQLAEVLATFKKEFAGKKQIAIIAKDEFRRSVRIVRGKTPVAGEGDIRSFNRTMPPPAGKVSPFGTFLNGAGQRIPVIFSKTPPRFDNGRPVFPEANLLLQETYVDISDVDRALFWYAFSKDVDSGYDKPLDPRCKYEIGRPEKAAEAKMKEINSNTFDTEIAFYNTRMSYENITSIMDVMSIEISGNEDQDRLKLLFEVKNNVELRPRYETAKKSILKELPKYDLSNTTTMIKEARKQGVLFTDKGWWMRKISETVSEKVAEAKGQKIDEQIFSLSEFLSLDPAAADQIKALMK